MTDHLTQTSKCDSIQTKLTWYLGKACYCLKIPLTGLARLQKLLFSSY